MEINRNMMEGLAKNFKQDFVHLYCLEDACMVLVQLPGRFDDYD
jgi:hypothetical protein